MTEELPIYRDVNGYPSDITLEAIKKFPAFGRCEELLDAIEPLWEYNAWNKTEEVNEYGEPIVRYRLATCGWSGNEDIIAALRENFIFWSLCWESSYRGGLYYFHVDKKP